MRRTALINEFFFFHVRNCHSKYNFKKDGQIFFCRYFLNNDCPVDGLHFIWSLGVSVLMSPRIASVGMPRSKRWSGSHSADTSAYLPTRPCEKWSNVVENWDIFKLSNWELKPFGNIWHPFRQTSTSCFLFLTIALTSAPHATSPFFTNLAETNIETVGFFQEKKALELFFFNVDWECDAKWTEISLVAVGPTKKPVAKKEQRW